MSVLIRGMEMPKTAGDCSTKIDPDTRRCIYTGKEFEETLSLLLFDRCNDCPLFEVPPHGRLIDADELKEDITEEAINLRMNGLKGTPRSTENHRWAIARLDEAKTIIEGSE